MPNRINLRPRQASSSASPAASDGVIGEGGSSGGTGSTGSGGGTGAGGGGSNNAAGSLGALTKTSSIARATGVPNFYVAGVGAGVIGIVGGML